MSESRPVCPDCESQDSPQPRSERVRAEFGRRDFLRASAAGAAIAALGSTTGRLFAADESKSASTKPTPETLVKQLYDSMSKDQKKEVCFDWDYQDPKLGLLRTRISNNWHITSPTIIGSDYYTKDQQEMVRAIYEGIINPEWHKKVDKQLTDDNGGKGWGTSQNVAIFGKPGDGKFELVMTGRHMTPLRRQQHRAHGFRRTNFLRSCGQRLQRKAWPPRQCLLGTSP